jgi:non-ribosomal peptide synthetase component F
VPPQWRRRIAVSRVTIPRLTCGHDRAASVAGPVRRGHPASITPEHRSGPGLLRAASTTRPHAPLVHYYFHTTRTVGEIDADSDALATALTGLGVCPGDRIAVYLQNVPQCVVALLGASFGSEFTMHEPTELIGHIRQLIARLSNSVSVRSSA